VIEWIVKNKEWLFSGVGPWLISGSIIVTVAAVKLIRDSKKRKAAANAPKPPPVHTRISALTVSEVSAALRNAPVLYRQDAAKPYIGVVVQWAVRLTQTYPEENGRVTLQLDSVDRLGWDVVCAVTLSHYPDLGRATSETPITVTGRITGAGGGEIQLDDAVLTFPETDARMEEEAENDQRNREIKQGIAQLERYVLSSHLGAQTTELFMRAPVLKDLPRTKPVAVVAVGGDSDGERLAAEIRAFLVANGYPPRTAFAFVPSDPPKGVSLAEQKDCLTVVVNLEG
jgi:hypothetical protein